MKLMKIGQLSAQETNRAPVVMSLAARLPIARLPRPATMAAMSGRKTMSWIMTASVPRRRPGSSCCGPTGPRPSPGNKEGRAPSPLHLVDVVDGDRAAAAEVDDQDGKSDRRLARRDGEDEHGEDLPDHVAEEGGEGDEVDVHREQDELDRHQDDDDVLAVEEDAEHAEHEQDRGDD